MKISIFGVPCYGGWLPLGHLQRLTHRLIGDEFLVLNRYGLEHKRLSKLHRAWNMVGSRSGGADVAVFLANSPSDLRSINFVPGWRTRFSTIVAYVCDSWYHDHYPIETRRFDHLFVSRVEDVEPVQRRTSRPTSYLPFGTNVLDAAPSGLASSLERSIDLLSYGRQPPEWSDDNLKKQAERVGLSLQLRFPFDPDPDRNQALVNEAAGGAKFSLGFCSTIHYHSFLKTPAPPFITFRWLDVLAAGSVMTGVAPKVERSSEVIGWDGACLDIPLEIEAGMDALAEAKSRYKPEMAARNHYESLVRNDWRLRIRDLLNTIGCPLPAPLLQELDRLEQYRATIAPAVKTVLS